MDDFTRRVTAAQQLEVDVTTRRGDVVENETILIPLLQQPDTSIDATLAERGARYGDFADHAKIAQQLQDDMRAVPGWQRLDATKRQALTVIADKIARILSGDPEYADNWHDIQGYAKLVEDRLGR